MSYTWSFYRLVTIESRLSSEWTGLYCIVSQNSYATLDNETTSESEWSSWFDFDLIVLNDNMSIGMETVWRQWDFQKDEIRYK